VAALVYMASCCVRFLAPPELELRDGGKQRRTAGTHRRMVVASTTPSSPCLVNVHVCHRKSIILLNLLNLLTLLIGFMLLTYFKAGSLITKSRL
jgi:hypothetical protein